MADDDKAESPSSFGLIVQGGHPEAGKPKAVKVSEEIQQEPLPSPLPQTAK